MPQKKVSKQLLQSMQNVFHLRKLQKKDFVKILLERVDHYGNHFLLMYDEEKLIAFVDGFVIYEPDLTDCIYENIAQS